MRKFFFVFLFVFIIAASLPAQMITSDILNLANLTQLINQVYATYDHIMATIEQVQNTYQQLKKQADMVMSMPEKYNEFKSNLGSIDLTNPEGFLKFRDQYKDTITYINYNMDLVNNIYDTFTKKKINFGGKNYTFGGLLGMPGADPGTTIFDLPRNTVEYLLESTEEGFAGYNNKLSRQQKEAIMQKYGMSPRNYYNYRLVEQLVPLQIDKALADASDASEELRMRVHNERNQYIEDLSTIAGDSVVAAVQTLVPALLGIGDDILHLRSDIVEINSRIASNQFKQDTINEMKAQQRLEEAEKRQKEENLRNSTIEFGNW
jgi:prefoldin subunit 5